jgi:hypothetical protein
VRLAEKLALLTVYASSFQAVAMFVAVMTGVGTFAALFVTDAKFEVDETETQPCRDEVMPDYGTL